MIDSLASDPVTIAAPVVVLALIALRWYFGSTLLALRFVSFWGTARRLYMPVLDRYGKRLLGFGAAENRAYESEHVGDYPFAVRDVVRAIDTNSDPQFEVSILSGLKTDWEENREVASIVGFVGSKPFPGAPAWLRAEQVHVFLFAIEDGTRVCAHKEANSYRPDLWRDHLYKGPSFDVQAGVKAVETWLGEP